VSLFYLCFYEKKCLFTYTATVHSGQCTEYYRANVYSLTGTLTSNLISLVARSATSTLFKVPVHEKRKLKIPVFDIPLADVAIVMA